MIDEIQVRNVALIKEAEIEPAEGLTVLTGETGSGKSALLSSLKLLVGDRADASSVREGADGLEVQGRFFTDDGEEDGHIVRRRLTADGRGKVDIDGHMASVKELVQTLGRTVDLCGQHEHQKLLDVTTHVQLLDAFAGEPAAEAREAYQEALRKSDAAHRELRRVEEASRASEEKLDEAAFVLSRIDEVGPSEEDYAELEEALPKAEHAEALMRAAEGAHEAVAGDDGVSDVLSAAVAELREAARFDEKLGKLADALESALIEAEDAASELRDYADSVELDPEELEHLQEREAAYQRLIRAYGPDLAHVLARRAEAEETVSAVQDGGERVRRAKKALSAAEAELAEAARQLSSVRAKAVPELAAAITKEMGQLEMGTASLEVSLEPLPRSQWTLEGPDHAELMYRPGAGLSSRPLRRIASGGEVSRVMLAAKVVLGDADETDTLVFDEVDAGVGGATANALAEVLKKLSRTHQVIVVTHLAQVAVMADKHYVVTKTEGSVPETKLSEVEGDARVHEIARMLSGDESEASLSHACEMLESVHASWN